MMFYCFYVTISTGVNKVIMYYGLRHTLNYNYIKMEPINLKYFLNFNVLFTELFGHYL